MCNLNHDWWAWCVQYLNFIFHGIEDFSLSRKNLHMDLTGLQVHNHTNETTTFHQWTPWSRVREKLIVSQLAQIFYGLWNPDAYYCVHKNLLRFSVVAGESCLHRFCFLEAHFNIILPPLCRSTEVWQNRMSMSWVEGCELFEQALIWVSCLALVVVNILVNAVCWTYYGQSFVSLFTLLRSKRICYI
jgi:hypothetical protein